MRTLVAILLVLLTLAFGACAWFYYFDTFRLQVVQPGVLYRDGFADQRRFENAYRQRPFKTFIDLRAKFVSGTSGDELAAERAFCKAHNIACLSLPLKLRTDPSQQQIGQFIAWVSNPAAQPVLMLDSDGILCVGMFAALWQKEGMGFPFEKTRSSVQLFDHPESPELLDFIKRLYNKQ